MILKITQKDDIYPDSLRKIKDPPKKLYLEGNIDLLNVNIISIIGSRSCTENGIKLATKFAKGLSKQGIVIASGMAIGIDSAAHRGTLKAKGKTIAVLGSGFNNIFPKENINLYNEIIKNNGLVITEYEPNIEPSSNRFLERNRIVSGLSIGILVVEAAHRSGTSVTARLATEQEKKVFVLPHEIGDIHGVGTNRLIRNGAILVTSPRDIIEEFDFLEYKELKINKTNSRNKLKRKNNRKNNKQNVDDKYKKSKNKEKEIKTQSCNNTEKIFKKKVKTEYQEVYDLIFDGINSMDELYKKTGLKVKDINNMLFMLELEGNIIKTSGGYKCI